MISDLFESPARKDALNAVNKAARKFARVYVNSPRLKRIAANDIRWIRAAARGCPEERLPTINEMIADLERKLAEE